MTTLPGHIHFDCRQGATTAALLAASLQILQERGLNLPELIQELSNRCDKDLQCSCRFGTKLVNGCRQVTVAVDSSSWSIPMASEQVSTFVTQSFDRILQLLIDQDVMAEDVVAIWSILICLDRIGVRSATYQPLPLTACRLLTGMMVEPVSSVVVLPPVVVAMIKILASQDTRTRPMMLESVATGLDVTNRSVRVTLSLLTNPQVTEQNMFQLECNIDDQSPEHLAFCVQQLLQAGAPDAWTSPATMKKGRAAQTLHCLAHPGQRDTMLEVMFRHSTTLGIRVQPVSRMALRRSTLTIETRWGPVDVKIGYWRDDEVVSVKAEFDDCRAVALEATVPIQQVADEAVRLARLQLDSD